jgi:hypothetical protein
VGHRHEIYLASFNRSVIDDSRWFRIGTYSRGSLEQKLPPTLPLPQRVGAGLSSGPPQC